MDLYHCQIVEGDVAMKLRTYLPTGRVGHLQIAGVPERHEPDLGELNYPYLFDVIDELGYDGWIGCEYRPAGGDVEPGSAGCDRPAPPRGTRRRRLDLAGRIGVVGIGAMGLPIAANLHRRGHLVRCATSTRARWPPPRSSASKPAARRRRWPSSATC